jgi:hypothetical protein
MPVVFRALDTAYQADSVVNCSLAYTCFGLSESIHRGADPCSLRAHHADFADFSNPSRPSKIKLKSFDPERLGMK